MPEGRIRHYNIKEVETKIHPIIWSAMAAKWLYRQYRWPYGCINKILPSRLVVYSTVGLPEGCNTNHVCHMDVSSSYTTFWWVRKSYLSL